MSQSLPLVAHADLHAPIAYRHAANGATVCIDVQTFLADVERLRASMPPALHVLNVCADRYRFMVGLAAAMCAGKISLLPSTHTPESVRQMRSFAADVFCLADGEVAIDLPLLRYPEELVDLAEPGDFKEPSGSKNLRDFERHGGEELGGPAEPRDASEPGHHEGPSSSEKVPHSKSGHEPGKSLPEKPTQTPGQATGQTLSQTLTQTLIPTLPADRIVAYVFTSGSTGTPVAHAKRWGALVGSVQAAARRLGIAADAHCTLVGTVPPQHMYGFESTVLLALQGGAAIWSGKPFYAADIATALAAVPPPRVLVSTPFHLHTFIEAQIDCPPVQLVLSATAPLSPELAQAVETRCSAPLLEIYGCTESGQIATRQPLADTAWQLLDGARLHQQRRVPQQNDLQPHDENSETWVEGDFIDGSIPLGDIIELVDAQPGDTQPGKTPSSGPQYFRLLGRNADLINIVGKRTSLGFLNQQLLAIPGVRDGCFFLPDSPASGKPDTNNKPGTKGDAMDARSDAAVARLAAFAVTDTLSAADIVRALRERIDPVFLPRPLHLVAQLPRNAAGKLPRAALLELWQHATRSAEPRR